MRGGVWLAVFGALVLMACGNGRVRDAGVEDTGLGVADVSQAMDAGVDIPPIDPCGPGVCGAAERCGFGPDGGVGSGNGLDDDCDGQVDEGCPCVQDTVQSCFPGPSDRRGVGPCRPGTARCSEGFWGACIGAVTPGTETCDGVDNDCDGRVDEDLDGCVFALRCPSHAVGRPLVEYVVDGRSFDPTARAFRWSVQCPGNVRPCPMISDPTAPELRLRPLQSGRYIVRVVVTRADGTEAECVYPLYVQGDGLRVELDWDTKGGIEHAGVDLDLHVSVIDRRRGDPARWFSLDDCYYATCLAPGGRVDWRTSKTDERFSPTMDVAVCAGAPAPYGERWRASGRCWNPRLDIDNVVCNPAVTDPSDPAFCFIENVNVDNPPEDVTFRVMVNFYRDHGTCSDSDRANDVTHPHLYIHCGGIVRAELGGVDTGLVPMPCARNPGIGSANWSWLAADVRLITNACGLQDCRVRALRASGLRFPLCERVTDADDVCQDEFGHLFVRRAGARPVDADLAASF